jgi:hypothetical protein
MRLQRSQAFLHGGYSHIVYLVLPNERNGPSIQGFANAARLAREIEGGRTIVSAKKEFT